MKLERVSEPAGPVSVNDGLLGQIERMSGTQRIVTVAIVAFIIYMVFRGTR